MGSEGETWELGEGTEYWEERVEHYFMSFSSLLRREGEE